MANIALNSKVIDNIKKELDPELTQVMTLKWDWKTAITNAPILYAFIYKLVVLVEEQCKSYKNMSPAERIHYASYILDEAIEFKGWFVVVEAFDDQIFKAIISLVVQGVNKTVGQYWGKLFKKM